MAATSSPDQTDFATDLPPWSGYRPYRITTDLYHQIAASGVFGDRFTVFLWKGQLVEDVAARPTTRPYTYALNKLSQFLRECAGIDYFVEQFFPMTVSNDSVLEPNLKIARGACEDYRGRMPAAYDVPLVVEVIASKSAVDPLMFRAYAESVIPVCWVVHVPTRRIDMYSRPTGPIKAATYSECQSFGPDDDVPVVLDGREVGRIAVRDVLP